MCKAPYVQRKVFTTGHGSVMGDWLYSKGSLSFSSFRSDCLHHGLLWNPHTVNIDGYISVIVGSTTRIAVCHQSSPLSSVVWLPSPAKRSRGHPMGLSCSYTKLKHTSCNFHKNPLGQRRMSLHLRPWMISNKKLHLDWDRCSGRAPPKAAKRQEHISSKGGNEVQRNRFF